MPDLTARQCSEQLSLREFLALTNHIDKLYKRYNIQFNIVRIARREDSVYAFCRIDGVVRQMKIA